MSSGFGFVRKTAGGYALGEVVSAIQKEIRRGNEREACYWAFESGPMYEAYLWRRLVIIANEDVGIANPIVLTTIPALRDTFFSMRAERNTGGARLALTNASLLLSRSPKTRTSDHLQCVVEAQRARGDRTGDPGLRPVQAHRPGALDEARV